ncbi:MAG: hypothetical protein ACOX7P_04905 [Oscillospiraceae bacterium]|jgi:H+/gluconate symporter-like permease
MASTLGIAGIITAIIAVNILTYKGLNVVLASFVAAAIVIFTNQLGYAESMEAGLTSTGIIMGNMAGIFVFGGILATLYSASSATVSLGRLILKPFAHNQNGTIRRIGTMGMLILVRVIIGLAGLDNLAIMPLMVALVLSIFSGANFPRKYINCMLVFASTVGTLIPGAPHQFPILFQSVVTEFDNSANLLPRWLLLLIYIVIGTIMLNVMIRKDEEKGMGFDPGPLVIPDFDTEEKTPHWLISVIPLFLVYITYNFLNASAWLSLVYGCVAAAILFFPYFKKEDSAKTRFGAVIGNFNKGIFVVPLVIVAGMVFSMVLSETPSFDYLCDLMAKLPIPATFGLMLIAILLTGASSGHAAMVIVGSIALSSFILNGMSVQTAGVIALWSTSVLDTLPNNIGIVMQSEMTACTMKECYPSIFKTTVIATFSMCMLVCVFGSLGFFPD